VAYVYTKNLGPAFGSEAIFNLKTSLKAAGWTVLKSSDGTTYNASGDQITQGATGAGGMRVIKAWFVITQPGAAFGSTRSLLIQNADATGTSFRIKYSAGAGFSGGSPAALVTPSAADEVAILGAGTDAAPTFATLFTTAYGNTAPVRQQIMCNNAAPYEWYSVSYLQGGGDTIQLMMCDVMTTGSFDVLDVDPYVHLFGSSTSQLFQTPLLGSMTLAKAWYRKGLAGALFTALGANQYTFGSSQGVAGTLGPNGYSNKDVVFPLLFARGIADSTAVGLKGQSTLLRWVGAARASGDTLSLVTTSDALCLLSSSPNCLAVPWDGSTPQV
jgi:hypothetical protein